jgi:pyridoxamine 5'-phosphate oxidase
MVEMTALIFCGGILMSIRDLRSDYSSGELNEQSAGNDPFGLFREWVNAALTAELPEPNAMTLVTVDPNGRPSSRIVLLRGFHEHGLEFYTNYNSRKARDMARNTHVALQFFWPELERQLRVEGTADKVSAEESDTYFKARPYETRLGAIASQQSEPLSDRSILDDAVATLRQQFPDDNVPRPANWGGYRIKPNAFEFWQGRPSRLHDRFRFTLGDGGWTRSRLWP